MLYHEPHVCEHDKLPDFSFQQKRNCLSPRIGLALSVTCSHVLSQFSLFQRWVHLHDNRQHHASFLIMTHDIMFFWRESTNHWNFPNFHELISTVLCHGKQGFTLRCLSSLITQHSSPEPLMPSIQTTNPSFQLTPLLNLACLRGLVRQPSAPYAIPEHKTPFS